MNTKLSLKNVVDILQMLRRMDVRSHRNVTSYCELNSAGLKFIFMPAMENKVMSFRTP